MSFLAVVSQWRPGSCPGCCWPNRPRRLYERNHLQALHRLPRRFAEQVRVQVHRHLHGLPFRIGRDEQRRGHAGRESSSPPRGPDASPPSTLTALGSRCSSTRRRSGSGNRHESGAALRPASARTNPAPPARARSGLVASCRPNTAPAGPFGLRRPAMHPHPKPCGVCTTSSTRNGAIFGTGSPASPGTARPAGSGRPPSCGVSDPVSDPGHDAHNASPGATRLGIGGAVPCHDILCVGVLIPHRCCWRDSPTGEPGRIVAWYTVERSLQSLVWLPTTSLRDGHAKGAGHARPIRAVLPVHTHPKRQLA